MTARRRGGAEGADTAGQRGRARGRGVAPCICCGVFKGNLRTYSGPTPRMCTMSLPVTSLQKISPASQRSVMPA